MTRDGLIAIAILAAASLCLVPGVSRADDAGAGILDRWKKGGKDSSTGEGESGKGADTVYKGYRVLKLNQRVSYYTCQANPASCQCPSGAQKVKFLEATSWGGVQRNTLMCVPSCQPGKLLRRTRDVKRAGRVEFKCEDPVDYGKMD